MSRLLAKVHERASSECCRCCHSQLLIVSNFPLQTHSPVDRVNLLRLLSPPLLLATDLPFERGERVVGHHVLGRVRRPLDEPLEHLGSVTHILQTTLPPFSEDSERARAADGVKNAASSSSSLIALLPIRTPEQSGAPVRRYVF